MTASGLPLPSDKELPPEAAQTLAALPPLNVFRAVAILPASLRPFLELGGSILAGSELTAREREFAILRVAHLTAAAYERQQHEQLARSLGMSDEEIDATAAAAPGERLPDDESLICRAAEEITRDVRLSDQTFDAVRARWGDKGTAELILTVGYYNMVSRFLESARVPLETSEILTDRTPDQLVREGRAAS
jgi:alkylhydroperoxidase family enzyme